MSLRIVVYSLLVTAVAAVGWRYYTEYQKMLSLSEVAPEPHAKMLAWINSEARKAKLDEDRRAAALAAKDAEERKALALEREAERQRWLVEAEQHRLASKFDDVAARLQGEAEEARRMGYRRKLPATFADVVRSGLEKAWLTPQDANALASRAEEFVFVAEELRLYTRPQFEAAERRKAATAAEQARIAALNADTLRKLEQMPANASPAGK